MRALTLVAITHHRAPFSILERVNLDTTAADALALDLRSRRGIDEAIVLATCNRTELYLTATPEHAQPALELLADHTGVPTAQLRDVAVVLDGDAASRHLFRVAAGLESRIIGEREILGQVRATAARAAGHGAAGPSLVSLFRWAAATGKRARRADGAAAPSLARTALDAVGSLGPDDLTIVLGAGTMAAALTSELRARHLPYVVAARRLDQAARLVRQRPDAIALDDLRDRLDEAVLVVCATSARTPVLHRRTVVGTRSGGRGKTLTVVDLSMPRNVEPGVGELDGVELVHLEELRGGGGELHARRVGAAVAAEHERYRLWLAGQTAGPLIAALRRQVTDICVDEALRHLPPDQAVQLARRTAGKILHAPTLALKALTVGGETAALEALERALGLEASKPRTLDDAAAAVS